MKNKKGIFINLTLLVVWIAFAVLLTWYAIKVLNANAFLAIICSIFGLAIHYFIALFFHEFGHFVFAKKNQMKISYVNFGFFSVDFTKDKKKVKFFTFLGQEAGESVFLPNKGMTKEKLCEIAFGGLLFSFLYALLGLVAILCIANGIAFCLLGIASVPSTYLLVVNCLSLDKTSDGALIFSKNDYGDVLVAVMQHERQVSMGIMPECSRIFEKSKEPLARFYYYKHLVVREKFKEAILVLQDLSVKLAHLTDDEYQLIFPEVIYRECLMGKISEQNRNYAENFFAGSSNELVVVRAHAAYRSFMGEKKWAETLNKTYEQLLKSTNKFNKEYEKRLKQFYIDKK